MTEGLKTAGLVAENEHTAHANNRKSVQRRGAWGGVGREVFRAPTGLLEKGVRLLRARRRCLRTALPVKGD